MAPLPPRHLPARLSVPSSHCPKSTVLNSIAPSPQPSAPDPNASGQIPTLVTFCSLMAHSCTTQLNTAAETYNQELSLALNPLRAAACLLTTSSPSGPSCSLGTMLYGLSSNPNTPCTAATTYSAVSHTHCQHECISWLWKPQCPRPLHASHHDSKRECSRLTGPLWTPQPPAAPPPSLCSLCVARRPGPSGPCSCCGP